MSMPKNTKKPVLLNPGHTDEIFTPEYALNPLIQLIPNNINNVWEPFWGEGHLGTALENNGFYLSPNIWDFYEVDRIAHFSWRENYPDAIITNPPYSSKDKVIEHCYELEKPFALLLPLTALEGIKRGAMYREHGIQLIIPNRRVNFITPNKGKSSWFATAWFTHGFDLEHDLNFVELERTINKDKSDV